MALIDMFILKSNLYLFLSLIIFVRIGVGDESGSYPEILRDEAVARLHQLGRV